jgi:hypothetical protein
MYLHDERHGAREGRDLTTAKQHRENRTCKHRQHNDARFAGYASAESSRRPLAHRRLTPPASAAARREAAAPPAA